METRKIGRDAATGKFKSVKDARKDKKGSVVETMKITSASKVDREGVWVNSLERFILRQRKAP